MVTEVYEGLELEVISTGSGELNKKIGGGIPVGSLTLIEGTSGSGKSTLSHHLLWGAMSMDRAAAVYMTENTVKILLRHMESLGMDVRDFLLMDLLRIYPLQSNSAGDGSQGCDALSRHMETLN